MAALYGALRAPALGLDHSAALDFASLAATRGRAFCIPGWNQSFLLVRRSAASCGGALAESLPTGTRQLRLLPEEGVPGKDVANIPALPARRKSFRALTCANLGPLKSHPGLSVF